MTQDKKNIGNLKNCYGCGVCVKACPVKIISLTENNNGFYVPQIKDQGRCVECGLCLDICAFNHNSICNTKESISYLAGWSNRPIIRQRCSSGGIGFELASALLHNGYEVCGVKYNIERERAEHFIASSEEDYAPSIGSKYLPSYTADALLQMDRKNKYLFTGTPCQVDSFRRYIRKMKIEDNYVLMDFFCHGVPSRLLWTKYLKGLKEKIGEIKFISWRNKSIGWHDSWSINADKLNNGESMDWHDSYNLKIRGKKHFYQSRWKGGDLFYRFFLGNYCLNHCCYKACKYKLTNSAADIRIGDLWGKTYSQNSEGVSGIVVLTEIGHKWINQLNNCTLESSIREVILESQMSHSPVMPLIYKKLLDALRGSQSLEEINNSIIKYYRLYCMPKRIINRICYKLGFKPLFH